ncbi:helix-turn-helix domain-containing protein [Streptococcus caviae]|uniref:AraC family transcriptional regulator n=1 Tax=Streptococcus sp. 'caviae' TaxID=1915004 RepID=UPI00094B79DA|nr:AraC family transcriptional regulator [Streptococcus sp. 'caviae']OLN84119.1 AraC family transcriptional regulator [Streptococcus sp. 'caviae']
MKLIITKQFQSFLKELGIDIRLILQRAQLSNKLWQEELVYNAQDYYRFMATLDKLITDEAILALSRIENIKMFVPAFFAALSSPDGWTALQRFSKYKSLIGPVKVQIHEKKDEVTVNYAYFSSQLPLPRMLLLQEQMLLLSLLRTGTGTLILPRQISSPYDYGSILENEAGILPQKSAGNLLVLSKTDLEKPFITENNVMWYHLEPSLNQQLSQLDHAGRLTQAVQTELLSAIPSSQFSLAIIASRLGLSSRTLQRQLAAEHTTFKDEVIQMQKFMTFSYLDLSMSVDDIAYLVGYSEKSAFLRAFKKWTGKTLKQYKKIHYCKGEKE